MSIPFNPFSSNKESPEIKVRKQEIGMQEDSDLRNQALLQDENFDYQGKSELIRWQQDMSSELKDMVMQLKNFHLDPIDGLYKPILDDDGNALDPLCNDLFIQKLISLLNPTTSKNVMMSKFTEDFIRNKLITLSNTVTLLLAHYGQQYMIKIGDYTLIVNIFQSTADPTFYRALGANEKKYIGSSYRHLTTEQDNKKQEKKPSWFNAKI